MTKFFSQWQETEEQLALQKVELNRVMGKNESLGVTMLEADKALEEEQEKHLECRIKLHASEEKVKELEAKLAQQ